MVDFFRSNPAIDLETLDRSQGHTKETTSKWTQANTQAQDQSMLGWTRHRCGREPETEMVGKREKPSGITEAALSQATSTAKTAPYTAQRTGHTETCRGAGWTGFQCHAFCRVRKLVTPAVGEGRRQTCRPMLQNAYASLPMNKICDKELNNACDRFNPAGKAPTPVVCSDWRYGTGSGHRTAGPGLSSCARVLPNHTGRFCLVFSLKPVFFLSTS